MRIYIDNIKCRAEFGGKDYLLKLPKQLREYLRVKVEGAFFAQKFGNRKWDGYRYFVNANNEFATGFLPMVYKFMNDLGAEVILIDERKNVPMLKDTWSYELPMYEGEAAPHQKRMLHSIDYKIGGLYFPRGIWDAATNARKTATLALLVNSVQSPRVLFLVHNTDLFDQHYKFFSQLFHVARINSKHYEIGAFTMAMVKTLYNRAKSSMTVARDLKQSFNIVVVDECHRAGAKEYSQLLQKVDAGMRVFMSGTPLSGDDDVSNMVIVGLSGVVLCKVSKKELMDAKISLQPTVHFYLNPAIGVYFSYEDEMTYLVKKNAARAEMIVDIIAERPNKKILINFVEREHGGFMYDIMIRSKKLENFYIDWVHGTDPDRAEKIQAFKDGKIQVLLSSSIMQEGINIADINTLVYAQGGRAKTPLSQWSGRTERDDGVSEGVEIIDIWDRGKYLAKHSNERKLFWLSEKFEIIYHYEQKHGRPSGQTK